MHAVGGNGVVELAPNESALAQAMDEMWDSDIERNLARDLRHCGIFAVGDFQLPGRGFQADFFLPAPPFGIVEIKAGRLATGREHHIISKVQKRLEEIRAAFGGTARGYLVLFHASELASSVARSEADGFVICTSVAADTLNIAKQIAVDFHGHAPRILGRTAPPATSLLADTNELTKPLSRVLFGLEQLMSDTQRGVLLQEFDWLRDEISHGHFTAAALRVGRSVEFIVYAACQSWGVPVREPFLLGLVKLENHYHALKAALIDYAGVADDARRSTQAKRTYTKQSASLNAVLMEILADLDEHAASQADRARPPLNTGALLTDIGRKFGAIETVRAGVAEAKKLIASVMEYRNAAAHASLDGGAREVGQDEVLGMIASLCQIIVQLARCGLAIDDRRRATSKPNG